MVEKSPRYGSGGAVRNAGGRGVVAPGMADEISRPGVTLYSSSFCGACTATRVTLDRAQSLLGDRVGWSEINVADAPELAESLGIVSTPTVVITNAAGAEVVRASGVPTVDQVLTGIASALD